MRPDPEAPGGRRRAALLTGLLFVLGQQPSAAQPPREPSEPAALLEEARTTADPQRRRRLAREALRALAGARPARPLLEAQAWSLFGQPDRGLELLLGLEARPQEAEWAAARAETALLLARAFLDRKQGALAERALSLAAPDTPGRLPILARARSLQGLALLGQGRREEALPALLEALEKGCRESDLVNALFGAARELDREGRLEAAIPLFEALAQALPEEAWAPLSLAIALRRAGRYDASDRVLSGAAGSASGDPEWLNERGLLEKARGRPAAAEALFRAALLAEPAAGPIGSARANLGLLLLEGGRPAEAEAVLAPLLSRPNPGTLPVLLWLRTTLRAERPVL